MTRLMMFSSFSEGFLRSGNEGGGGSGSAVGGGGGAAVSSAGSASATPSAPSGGSPQSAPSASPASGGGELSATDVGEFPDIPADLDAVEIPAAAKSGAGAGATKAVGGETAPVSVAAAPAPSVAPVAAPAAPVAQVEEPITRADQVDLQNVDRLLAANASALQQNWADTLFALSKEESDALLTNPEQVLPQFAAKVLYHALRAIPGQIKQFVPGLLTSQLASTEKAKGAEGKFFDAWPGLKTHTDAVTRAIYAVRQANPRVTLDDAIKQAGTLVCLSNGLDVGKMSAAVAAAAASSGVGAMSGAARGAQVAPPFRPAGAGVAQTNGAGGPGGQDDDPWSGFDLPHMG